MALSGITEAVNEPRLDKPILAIFALALLVISFWDIANRPQPNPTLFGGEYWLLAESLVEGRGFSGPFGRTEHPSAWMPPLLPFVIAGLFVVFGTKSAAAADALILLDSLFLWVAMWAILKATRTRQGSRVLLAGIFVVYLCLDRHSKDYFHDPNFILMLSTLALLALVSIPGGKTTGPALTALILPLSSPALALAFILLLPFSKASRKKLFIVAACWLLSLGCWGVRNAVTFHAFIPVKSNLWFDFEQANILDPDGVASSSTFLRHHPFTFVGITDVYEEQGELGLIRLSQRESLNFLRERPATYARKLFNRLVNATVFTRPHNDLYPMLVAVAPPTLATLARQRLVFLGYYQVVVWCCLDLPEAEFRAKLRGLKYEESEEIVADWEQAEKGMNERNTSPFFIAWGVAHGALPTLVVMAGVLRRRVRKLRLFRIAAGIYVLYLAPYVLVSHYDRYSVPLVGLVSVMIWLHFTKDPISPPQQ